MKPRLAVLAILSCILTFMLRGAELSSCDEASLRAAIAGGGEISFTCDGTITLSSTIQVIANTTLRANGHNVTLSGGGKIRLFLVGFNVSFTLDGVAVVDAFLQGAAGFTGQFGETVDGGAILSFGFLTCNNCVFDLNRALGGAGGPASGAPGSLPGMGGFARGGAICSGGGSVYLTNCVFRNNQSSGGRGGTPGNLATGGDGRGGALYALGGGFSLTRCVFSNNVATFAVSEIQPGQTSGGGEGGAAFVEYSTLTARDCDFIANSGAGGDGGDSSGRGGVGRGGVLRTLSANVALTNCRFEQNAAIGGHGGGPSATTPLGVGDVGEGGMAYCSEGLARFTQCRMTENRALPGDIRRFGVRYSELNPAGGAIYNSGATVELMNCELSKNSAVSTLAGSAFGGALYQASGTVNINQCNISTNQAIGGDGGPVAGSSQGSIGHGSGGAIYVRAGTMNATNSAFTLNVASGGQQPFLNSPGGNGIGGGLYHISASTGVVENCTLAGNRVRGGDAAGDFGQGGNALGGAICNPGSLLITHATIASNSAQAGISKHQNGAAQGGVYLPVGALSRVEMRASILAANQASNWFGAAPVDRGYNLSSDASCRFSDATSVSNTDPVIGPLGDYGGPTPTMPLLSGSPAIDAITSGPCLLRDQRGRARPFGAACDIGAFESSAPYTIRGTISGPRVPSGIEVSEGSQTTITAADFTYRFDALAAGTYVITPSHVQHLTVPMSQTVLVGPDIVGVDFEAYRWNSLLIEKVNEVTARLIYAGTNGDIVHLESATQLPDWRSNSVHTVVPNGLIETFQSTTGAARFFRTVIP